VQASIINIQSYPKQKTPKGPSFVPKSNHVVNIRSISRSDHRRVVCSEKQTRRMQKGMQKQPAMMPEIRSKGPGQTIPDRHCRNTGVEILNR
jgi:hypothetical protein